MEITNFWALGHLLSYQQSPKAYVHAVGGSKYAGGLGGAASPPLSPWEHPVEKEGSKTSEAPVTSESSTLTKIVLFYAKKFIQIRENLG